MLKPFEVFKKMVVDKQKWVEFLKYIYDPALLKETPTDYSWNMDLMAYFHEKKAKRENENDHLSLI